MRIQYRYALAKIQAFVSKNKNFLVDESNSYDSMSLPAGISLLPKNLGESHIERMPHPDSFRRLNRLYQEYQLYLIVLEFIIENSILYDELRALDKQSYHRRLSSYEDEIREFQKRIQEIQEKAKLYRRSFSEKHLKMEQYYPTTLPPSKAPEVDLLFDLGAV